MGAGTGFVTRIMQHILPTPLERGQIDSLAQNLDLARERLASEEQRTRQEWIVRENLLLKQLDAQARGQVDAIEMQRWPLSTPAGALNRHSAARGGASLNVILYRAHVHLTDELDKEAAQLLMRGLDGASRNLEVSSSRAFGRDVSFYNETFIPPNAVRSVSGQQAVATISSLTSTQPFVLIEVTLRKPTSVALHVTCWGWGSVGNNELASESTHINVELKNQKACSLEIENSILILIGLLGEQYQTLRRLTSPPSSPLWGLDSQLDTTTFSAQLTSGGEDVKQSGREMVHLARRTMVSAVARKSNPIAAEIASKLSVDAFNLGHVTVGHEFLEMATKLYREYYENPGLSAEWISLQLSAVKRGSAFPRAFNLSIGISTVSEALDHEETMEAKDPIELLEEKLAQLPPNVQKILRRKMKDMISYSPKVAVFGKAGVGKSSICNKLFGRDAFHVSPVDEGTTSAQSVDVSLGDGEFTLIDLPGVGLNIEKDSSYAALYDKWLGDVDAILWVIKADDRALAEDEEFHRSKIAPKLRTKIPIIFVINQCDKIDPVDNWNRRENEPGAKQKINLELKRAQLSRLFKLDAKQSASRVVLVAADRHFGLQDLLLSIIESVPRHIRPSILNQASPEAVSKESVAATETAVQEELVEALALGGLPGAIAFGVKGAALGAIGGPIGVVVGAAAGAIVGAVAGGSIYKSGKSVAKAGWRALKKFFS
jgi:small GTP-binding protein